MDVEFALFVAAVGTFLFGLVGVAADAAPKIGPGWRSVAWFPPLFVGVLLVVYVAGEDGYGSDGRSRWEVYDAQPTMVGAVVLAFAGAVGGYAALRRPALLSWAAIGCLVVAVAALAVRLQTTN
ncbi:MAG: hypothetical protein ACT4QF_13665 [Sporichthyaceae bacterium]